MPSPEHSEGFPDRVERALQAARAGDPSGIEILFKLYHGYLLTIASEKLGPELVAKTAPSDLVQETLLKAAKSLPEFRGSTEPEMRKWLLQILLRNVLDVRRHYVTSDKRNVSKEVPLDKGADAEGELWGLVGKMAPPSARAKANDRARVLQEAMSNLSEEHRQVILLRTFDGLEFDEVGQLLGRSSGAARKLWVRAIEHLTSELKSHDPGSLGPL